MEKKLLIKVCGNTLASNLQQVCKLHPNYLGFIFYSKSKRKVAKPEDIVQPANCKAKRVGVFVNTNEQEIREKVDAYQLDIIQLHGNETPEFCTKINKIRPVFKAFQLNSSFNFSILNNYISACYYFLFDTASNTYGGSGNKFDWNLLKDYQLEKPFILSGGISGDDVELIKKIDHPKLIGLDLNSRFETEPGVKDVPKLSQFLTQLNA